MKPITGGKCTECKDDPTGVPARCGKMLTCQCSAAVQHLGLFVPWEKFLSADSGDINAIWEQHKQTLSRRMSFLVDNVQQLRRTAEDAKRDAKQWAAQSEGSDPVADGMDSGMADVDEGAASVYRSDEVGDATRLIDFFRGAVRKDQGPGGSQDISEVVQKLCRFQSVVSSLTDELSARVVRERRGRMVSVPGSPFLEEAIPALKDVGTIASQQRKTSGEIEKMIQGIQTGAIENVTSHGAAVYSVTSGFGEQNVHITDQDSEGLMPSTEPSTSVQLGPATSFSEVGRQLAEELTLNYRQSIAVRIICRQLDRVRRDENVTTVTPQLCQFIGGEGGTGKSRTIEAVVKAFARQGVSGRLLITATSGTAGAGINGITIHSACGLSVSNSAEDSQMNSADRFCRRCVESELAGEVHADYRRGQHAGGIHAP
jgi:hypothetical protein